MRLLLVEPEAEGHHLVLYTRLILKEAARRGWKFSILTTETGRRHAAFDVVAADHGGELPTISMPNVPRRASMGSCARLRAQWGYWNALAEASRANDEFREFDLVYCINLDYFEKALSLRGSPFGGQPFAGMLMNPKFHRSPMGLGPRSRADGLYRRLFRRLLRIGSLKRLMVIDEPFQQYCAEQAIPLADKLCVVSDVGELADLPSRAAARDRLGVAPDAFVILIYGSLARRKGVEQLLRAVASIDDERVVALVAGKPDGAIEALLASRWRRELEDAGRIIVRPHFHDDEDEAAVFSAADAAWLGYIGGAYGSSGVLYQAGSAGLPVISMKDGLVGWSVREHKLGIALDASNIAEVAEAIELLHHDEAMRQACSDNGRSLAAKHTGAAFGSTLCDVLEAAASDSQVS